MIREFMGIEDHPATHVERWVSGIGGLLSIAATILVSIHWVGMRGAVVIIPSMGASAVLLFAVPHGSLAQPWNLIGGHLISALVGVACARWFGPGPWAAGAAVGGAITAMYYLRCIHPPGGATALAAVIGGPAVHQLGFLYALTPIMTNVAVMFAVALAFNALFPWRRYPAYLVRKTAPAPAPADHHYPPIDHADLVYALSQIDSFIDVTEEDLLRIYDLATGREARTRTTEGS